MNTKQQNNKTNAAKVDTKLEVAIIPVSDVERSKRFYESFGWRFDDDVSSSGQSCAISSKSSMAAGKADNLALAG
jgi:predicted enzyme related to lactoylglutathione lyase